MLKSLALILTITGLALGQLSFTAAPSLTKEGSTWQVEFAISENADVEVSIVDPKDSSVVRHLAAGVLGANAPSPLAANTLAQSIAWDGLDDFGNIAAQPESLSARVRAGMSVKLICFGAERLNMFPGAGRVSCGLIPGDNGSVYLQGKINNVATIRQYDAQGNYMKTVFPPPAGLPADSVTSYGINVLPEGGWAPKTTYAHYPSVTTSLLNSSSAYLMPIGGPGELVVSDGMNIQRLTQGGACLGASTRLITPTPQAPAGFGNLCGPRYFTASHNPEILYLTGWYYAATDGGSWLLNACDTGFWADGQVFKVDKATGMVTPWIRLDSIPVSRADRLAQIGGGANATATIHGVAIDDAGHVFVCDRLHKRISVYDTNAVLVGSVPVLDPDLVALSERTGAIYVATRADANGMTLVKLSGWDNQATALDTVRLTNSVDTWMGSPALVVVENGNVTNIWVGYSFGFRMYTDDGSDVTLSLDFGNTTDLPVSALSVDRLAVDPKTETVYWGQSNNYKITDWSNPGSVAICSTTSHYMHYRSGVRVRSGLDDITIAPNGYIYGYHAPQIEPYDYNTPVRRYKADFSGPLVYANTDTNASTCRIGFESSGAGGKHRGMAVGWQGQIAVSADRDPIAGGHDNNAIYLFPDTGYAFPDSSWEGGTPIITNLSSWASGVKFDVAGNVYAGTNLHPADWQVLPGFATDPYSIGSHSGSIVKYAPGTTGTISGGTAVGAAKVYSQPYGTYPGGDYSGCICRTPRFDVDPYGRLYIPFASGSRISVVDNAGTTILAFGQYGNMDARGGLGGPGLTYAEPAFPLAWPNMVAASEDYIYVGDYMNQRIMRVQKLFELDNIPGLTDRQSGAEKGADWKYLAMTASPNPFNPVSTIRVSMPAPGKVRLAVYGADGRLVKEIASGKVSAGLHAFTWNADQAAAGVYFYRLTAGNRVLTVKTVLAK